MPARDARKDQSYFLWTLTQEQLKHCLFPIGDYLKPQVRAIARKAGLPTAEKRDSQGICFLGKVNLADFLKKHIPEKRGAVLTTAGEKIGEHDGAEFYTIGQRHIGVSNREPIYVTEKNLKNNTLVVAAGEENQALYKKEIELSNVNFINPIPGSKFPLTVYARARYRQPLAKAKFYKLQTTNYKLIFEHAQKFIAPGQSAVFYGGGDELLGGGVIV
jgi:tRNA-specific 2-thiouridylase